MNNRGVLVYAGLLVLALGGAYVAWTHEDERDLSESVVVLDAEADDITSITYETDRFTLTLVPKEDEFGTYLWGETKPKAEAADEEKEKTEPEMPDPHGAPPPPKIEAAAFKAGLAGDDMLEKLAPFTAKRELEGITSEKLEELGLDDPDGVLTISRDGRESETFEIGGNVYGGSNVYVREPGNGKVYVVDAKLVRSLEAGERGFSDRRLFGASLQDVEAIEVRVGESSATFEQRNPDDPSASYWSAAGSDEKSPVAGAWLDKVLRLHATQYVPASQEPKNLEEAYSFVVRPRSGEPTTVVLYRAWSEGDQGGEDRWFARSEHTRGLVEVGRADEASETAASVADVLGS